MDDLLWNGSWSNQEDSGCKQSLFVSDDPSRCSSPPPLQDLRTVLGLPEIKTPVPEMKAVELDMDPKLLCEREKSWPGGASSGGVLLEVLANDKGTAPVGAFWNHIFENQKPTIIEKQASSANNNGHFQHPTISSPSPSLSSSNNNEVKPVDREAVSRMKELIYHAAVFRPVNLELETVEKKRRRNVKTSKEPQTMAARKRREKISEKIRVLQRLVPGGSKMDTASMLDEAASYLKFLRAQIKALEGLSYKVGSIDCLPACTSFNSTTFPTYAYFPL